MKTALLLFLLVTITGQASDLWSRILPPGDLAGLKAEAEKGNPAAQNRLANAYCQHLKWKEASEWYSKAAAQGNQDALFNLGQMLQSGKPDVPKDERQAFTLLYRAANIGHNHAQREVGEFYREGRVVQRDSVEAFKWFAVSKKQGDLFGKTYLDKLILELPQEQIEEGQRRAAQFRPKQKDDGAVPQELNVGSNNPQEPGQRFSPKERKGVTLEESTLAAIRLRTISGSKAFINNKGLRAGESADLRTPDGLIHVECLAVEKDSVLLKIEGIQEPRKFFLPRSKSSPKS